MSSSDKNFDDEKIRKALDDLAFGDQDRGTQVLFLIFEQSCVRFIRSKTDLSINDGTSRFHDSLLILQKKIRSGDFVYEGGNKLKNYLFTIGLNKALQSIKGAENEGMNLPVDDWEKFEQLYMKHRMDIYHDKEALYGIEIPPGDPLPITTIVKAFHQLKDRDRVMIMLKVVFGVSHREIVDKAGLFYPLKNEAVSRALLRKYLKRWREKVRELIKKK